MKNKLLSDEQVDAVLQAFEKALANDVWASSAFLRVMGKKLQGIHDAFQADVLAEKAHQVEKKEAKSVRKIRDTQRAVYVLLYATTGADIKAWEQILANLPRQIVSRPIYASEEEASRAIPAAKKIHYAYAEIHIDTSDFLSVSEERVPHDKRGTPLLMLKDNALSLDKIAKLVHSSGVYTYARGRLIKDSMQNSEE